MRSTKVSTTSGWSFEVLLAAKNLSKACGLLRLDWDTAHRIRAQAVERGLARRQLEDLRYLGLDEKSFGRGHSYGTVLTDLEGKRVVEVVQNREEKSVREVYGALGLPV